MSKRTGSSLPTVTSQLAPDVRNFLDRVRDILISTDNKQVVSRSDLVSYGLINQDGSLATSTGELQYGVPPVVTNFVATGAYRQVIISWDTPNYPGHAYTEIWASDIWDNALVPDPSSYDDLALANLLYTSGGSIESDSIGNNSGRYYWARNVNLDGTAGPFNAVGGTRADTAIDVEYILGVIAGSISESELTETLSSRIDLIDADASVVGSVAYLLAQEAADRAAADADEASARAAAIADEASARAAAIAAETSARVNAIAQEILDRNSAITTAVTSEATARTAEIQAASQNLQSQINDLLAVEAYDNTATYAIDDQVTYNGKLYRAIAVTTGNLPTDTNYWDLLGNYSSLGDFVGQNAANIVEINTVSATSTSASAQALYGLKTLVEDPATGLAATVSAVDSVEARVDVTETGIAANLSSIEALQTTINDPNTGLAATVSAVDAVEARVDVTENGIATNLASIEALETTVNDPNTGLAATVSAVDAVEARVDVTENGIATNLASIEALETTVNDPDTGVAATANALDSVKTAVEDTDTGLAATVTRVGALETTVNDATTGLVATSNALDVIETAVNDSETGLSATAARVGVLETAINDETTGLSATAATLDSVKTAVENTDTGLAATAAKVEALETTVNDTSTGVVATANALDTIELAVNDADTGLSATLSKVEALETTVNDPNTGVAATAQAVDVVTLEVFPDGITEASAISQLSTTVGENTASVEAQAASIDGLEAKYTVKIDVNGAVAGYGLASKPNSAGNIVSEFIVNADRFAILKGATDTGTATVPFTVYTTAQTHNGVTVQPGVYMADAFIADGTITTAKIGLAAIDNAQIADAAITNAKINDLDAGKITAGFISADRIQAGTIDADKIAANAITADKILAETITGDLLAATDIITGSAQISNAVITSAKIADAAITNAKIDDLAVGTIKIADQAVTIPSAEFTGTGVIVATVSSVFTNWVNIQSITWTSTGADTLMNFYCDASSNNNSPAAYAFRIVFNSATLTTLGEVSMEGDNRATANRSFAISRVLYPTAGVNTVTIQAAARTVGGGASSATMFNRTLSTIEVKK